MPPAFFFFLRIALANLGFLWFHIYCKIICSSYMKNVMGNVIGNFHSFPMLVRLCSKSFKLAFSIMCIENFQMYKISLEKAEEQEIKLSTFIGSQRKQGNSRKTSTSVSLTMQKALTVWVTTNCVKFFKRWEC